MTNHDEIIKNVKLALEEDIGSGDVTTDLVEPYSLAEATLISHDNAILCGIDWFNEVFNQLDNSIEIKWLANDGEKIKSSQTICNLHGPIHSILSGERTAINFLQLLSGVSTNVAAFVSRIKNTKTKILDTRKTTPGLRVFEKFAVFIGGGTNHRFSLKEAVIIKDNHLIGSPNIKDAVEKALNANPNKDIQVEVDTKEQLQEALYTRATAIMLDNFSPAQINKTIKVLNNKKLRKNVLLEASGGITSKNISKYGKTDVDIISIGSITNSVKGMVVNL